MTKSVEIPLPKRLSWSRLPTPVHKLQRISEELQVDIFVKRDDVTGFVTGGNKIRKLDYLFREAVDQKATCVISCGGVQSNHCRAVAAVAAHYGMDCILILRGEKPSTLRANLLLDYQLGAQILYVTEEEYEQREQLRRVLEAQVHERGGKPYYIPEGGSNPLGVMGYVEMWRELQQQLGTTEENFGDSIPEHFDSIVHATGSGGTQAGLILGRIASAQLGENAMDTRIIGANVCYDKTETYQIVKDLLWKTIAAMKWNYSFLTSDIECLDGFIGEGYAISTEKEREFYIKIARTEGILLDPVYTGKAFYGLYQTLKRDKTYFGKNVLFLHTGGAFGNFKYDKEWDEILLEKATKQ